MQDCYELSDLLALMARLREPVTGCPWDLAQSYQSITSSTLEEAYEVVDAIENRDYPQLKEELGDLLFQVVFYSQLAREDNFFDFQQVVSAVTAKLLRRHPHVFPDGTLASSVNPKEQADDSHKRQNKIKASWERIKQQEREQKGHRGLLDDIPKALPATVRALKLQKRAAGEGFDWPSIDGVYDKLDEEIAELKAASSTEHIEEELGDLLFTVINLARHLRVEPERALRHANGKFEQRFRAMEQMAIAGEQGLSEQSAETLGLWWDRAKRGE